MCQLFVACLIRFFCMQKTAYEMRISDWSSDVCSSDLPAGRAGGGGGFAGRAGRDRADDVPGRGDQAAAGGQALPRAGAGRARRLRARGLLQLPFADGAHAALRDRSEEHTSELQSLMRISYAVFCLKKKNIDNQTQQRYTQQTNT